ncbi:MAG TPA: hypothetical protein VH107_03495 [Lacipirellulaceae bacterium]|jgi:hypothetical protein|nr:hypothetical protein [Lacipirellulaceae bacterium]
MNSPIPLLATSLLALFSLLNWCAAAPHPDGELTIEVVDSATGQPIPARIHLSAGRQTPVPAVGKAHPKRSVKLMLPGAAEFGGHFYIDGKAKLPLKVGQYTFELEATPEYLNETGQFEIERHADDSKRVEMKRVVDLAKEGWYGGDLDTNRNAKDLPLIERAEGLKVVPNIDTKKTPDDMPADIDGHLIARTPYAWDLPVWLTGGKLAAIELIHRHSLRNGVVDNENDGRPRDKTLFPGQRGNGRWSETVYYHVLDCGFRLPPVAGSGSGANDNPVGTNRVYVHCGSEFSKEGWWEALQAGQVFVTNGPLLRPTVEGEPPGYVFHTDASHPATFEIGLNLATRVPVEYLQIIKNGSVDAEVRLAEWKDKKGKLPPVTFDASGWFLVRAVTSNPQMYQLASTGPYFVEAGDQPRISKKSVQFFLDWITAAEEHLHSLPNLSADDLATQLAQQDMARKFFAALLARANAE